MSRPPHVDGLTLKTGCDIASAGRSDHDNEHVFAMGGLWPKMNGFPTSAVGAHNFGKDAVAQASACDVTPGPTIGRAP